MRRLTNSLIALLVTLLAISHSSIAQSLKPPLHPQALEIFNRIMGSRDTPYKRAEWEPITGPWADYIAKTYVEQFSEQYQANYRSTLEREGCVVSQELEAPALLKQYPFLRTAHVRIRLDDVFEMTVLTKSPNYKFCTHWSALNKVVESIRAKGLNLLPFDYNEGSIERILSAPRPSRTQTSEEAWLSLTWYSQIRSNVRKRLSASDREEAFLKHRAFNSLCNLMPQILKKAIDDDDKAAILALVRLSKHPQLVKFTKSQMYYFYLRAEQLNILPSESTADMIIHHHAASPATRSKVERFIENGRKGYIIFPTPLTCDFPWILQRQLESQP